MPNKVQNKEHYLKIAQNSDKSETLVTNQSLKSKTLYTIMALN